MLPVLLAASLLTPSEAAVQVEPTRVSDVVSHLSGGSDIDGAAIESRHILHPDHDRAGDWLQGRFEAIDGLEVQAEPFSALGEDDLRNIIADLPSAAAEPAGRIVFAAHWDSTASAEDDWEAATTPAPGADDDASGIAVLLEAATLLAAYEPGFAYDLRFIAFDAEEVGLVGSFHHVDALDEPVDVAIVFDPVGYNPGGSGLLWFAYHADWPEAGDEFLASADAIGTWLDVSGVNQASIGGDDRSDHFPFWDAGIPAIHIGSFPQPPAYHTSGDTLEVVDSAFLAEVAAIAAAHAVRLAEPLEPIEEGDGCTGCDASAPRPLDGGILLVLAAVALGRRTWRRC